MALSWTDNTRFDVDGVAFACATGPSTRECFCVRKPRPLVEATVALLDELHPDRIVELGIASGGSTALLALVARPEALLALELDATRVDALDELIAARGLAASVRAHYGVDQGDAARVAAIVDAELGDAPLDLVIDDASHRLVETKASFEVLFPRVRPGGAFVIEDWNWQLQLAFSMARGDHAGGSPGALEMLESAGSDARTALRDYVRENAARTPLVSLALELVLARACSGDVVSELRIDGSWVVVTRGPETLDSGTFRLADCYVDRFGLVNR